MDFSDAVEALSAQLVASWNDRDAVGFSDLFADDGSLVGFDGTPVESRAAIAGHLQAIFADHQPAAYVAKVGEVRSPARGVALLRSVAGMVPPGEADIKPEVNAVQSVSPSSGRSAGTSRISRPHRRRSTDVPRTPRPSPPSCGR